jgi:hypothetical protein
LPVDVQERSVEHFFETYNVTLCVFQSRQIFAFRAKAASQRAESALAAVERAHLHLLRVYRTGRVPDVSISLRDVLQPLLSLAARESRVAVDVLRAVIAPIVRMDENAIRPALGEAVNQMACGGRVIVIT